VQELSCGRWSSRERWTFGVRECLVVVDRVLEEDGCLGCAKASGRMDDSVVDDVLSASELRDPLMPRGQFSRFVTRESFFQVKDLRARRF
jgi:hypothetical protein